LSPLDRLPSFVYQLDDSSSCKSALGFMQCDACGGGARSVAAGGAVCHRPNSGRFPPATIPWFEPANQKTRIKEGMNITKERIASDLARYLDSQQPLKQTFVNFPAGHQSKRSSPPSRCTSFSFL